MIGGQMDVETAWPNYVAEYEAAGAAELETMVNEAIAHSPRRRVNFIRHCPQQPAPLWGAAPCPEPRHDGIPVQTEKYAPRAARRRTKRFRRV